MFDMKSQLKVEKTPNLHTENVSPAYPVRKDSP